MKPPSWPAASLMDSNQSVHGSSLVIHGAERILFRVSATWIVEAFDIVEHIGSSLVSCGRPVDPAPLIRAVS